MPIYQYKCKQSHVTDRVKKITISANKLENDVCDICHAKAKLIPSKPALPILVGAGFHVNDFHAPTH